MNLGAWLGRHQAFGLIANRCSAADAECLKAIRDGGEYKQFELTWEQFCGKHAGVSRVYADRQIHCLEEFGGNYFRFADVMPIPLVRENRGKVAAAIEAMRAKPQTKAGAGAEMGSFRKRLDVLLAEAHGIANHAGRRLELIGVLEEGGESLHRLALALREKTLVLR